MFPITYFARSNYRGSRTRFGIKHQDRFYHFYVFGKTGTGKSTLLKTKIIQDIINKNGVCFFDPHGDAVSDIVKSIPTSRKKDLIYFDLTDPNLSWGYNPLRNVPYMKRSLVCGSILSVFERLWKSAWGPKMEHILRMVLLTLLDQPSANLRSINQLLLDSDYRLSCLPHIINEDVRKFWQLEFPKYKSNELLPILSKTGGFLSHPIIKKVLIENSNAISIRGIMDSQKILMINLAKGSIGTDVANILGSLFLTTIASASFSRIDTPEEKRVPFFLYVDEFQTLTNEDLICEMLSELRKFRIALTLANQYLNQISTKVRDAILGNIGTIVCFRLSIADARLMVQEFELFDPHDFTHLPQGGIYLRMMIDKRVSRAFSADTSVHYLLKPKTLYEDSRDLLRWKGEDAQSHSSSHSKTYHLYRKFRRWIGRLFRKAKSQD